ncbi:uncharacterized protein LOC110409979 [Herrania umbratica]|uniref:Uncharacterized protein LOC110409979 n=1 Tax=Herrania umbratica TaxID=108875 RepID=A0A6J0ZL68_9ROSI|nr:uncharacterized protein LOC110409979 [Herrania umbratica]
MNLSSWFHSSVSRNSNKSKNPEQQQSNQSDQNQQSKAVVEEEEELFGVTQQLIDYVKSFTSETFKNFPLQDHEAANSNSETQTSSNVRKDLSDWQERHAVIVLAKVKVLSQLRFQLCPRHLKEDKFWRIYFMLVKSHVAGYELQAVLLAKLKGNSMSNEKTLDTSAYEVEMAERNQAASIAPSTP